MKGKSQGRKEGAREERKGAGRKGWKDGAREGSEGPRSTGGDQGRDHGAQEGAKGWTMEHRRGPRKGLGSTGGGQVLCMWNECTCGLDQYVKYVWTCISYPCIRV